MTLRTKRKGGGRDADAPALAAARGDGPAAAAGPGAAARAVGAAAGDGAGAEAAAAPAARQGSGAQAGTSPAPAVDTPGQREPEPGAHSPAPGPTGAGGPSGLAAGPPARGAVLADALDVASDLRAMLECPICTEIMLPPHVICYNGHTSCLGCYEKLRAPGAGTAGMAGRCPSCKEPLYAKPARNLALESAAKRIAMPCPFADHGCPQTMLYEAAAAHARSCRWRAVACGNVTRGRKCGARVCLEKMAAHWIEAHEAQHDADVLHWPEPDKYGTVRVTFSSLFSIKSEDISGDNVLLLRRTARGGAYDIDLKRVGANMRLGLRQFGSDPDGYTLKEVVLTLGDEDGTFFRHVLPRALAADECLADDALMDGRKPAVVAYLSRLLTIAAVKNNDDDAKEWPWILAIFAELQFVPSKSG